MFDRGGGLTKQDKFKAKKARVSALMDSINRTAGSAIRKA